jgi:hypothetical protein
MHPLRPFLHAAYLCIATALCLAVPSPLERLAHQDAQLRTLETTVVAQAWRHEPNDSFPEDQVLHQKHNVGLCFSGGGSRSFAASMGYLQGLVELNLLDKVKYISAVSGGAWATAAYVFHDPNVTGPLESFFGDALPPERQTLLAARRMPKRCARGYPVRTNLITTLPKMLLQRQASDAWAAAVHKTFLEPAGISLTALPAWSRAQAQATEANNPRLKFEFVLPCGGLDDCPHRPFPIINVAQLGPLEAPHLGGLAKNYVMMEMTPMYVGFPKAQVLDYFGRDAVKLGGLMEPVGFGFSSNASFAGLNVRAGSRLSVPLCAHPFALANFTAASSWAHGALLKQIPSWGAMKNATFGVPYFNPVLGGSSRELQFGDGGNLENQGIIALLRRNVSRIVMFVNSQTPLPPWEDPQDRQPPLLHAPLPADLDSSFAALFGVRPLLPKLGVDSKHVHVFPRSALAYVLGKLQQAQLKGNGCIATVNLLTVENPWHGISPGRHVRVTIVYLGRVFEWERLLPSKVADRVVSNRSSKRSTDLPTNGTFTNFPHLEMSRLHLSSSVANMMADLAWWVVMKNSNVFRNELMAAHALPTGSEVASAL